MAIDQDALAKLMDGIEVKDTESLLGEGGLFGQLKKAIVERALRAELEHHLAQEREGDDGERNHKNGSSKKTVISDGAKLELSIPRDRAGSFEPQMVAKYQRRLPDFDNKLISMYARGMTVREIQAHLQEIYGTEVSPNLISTVTDEVHAEVLEWQKRPLDRLYPIVYFDALRVRIRDEGTVKNKAVYLALGIAPDGRKEVLGMWIEQTEGAKFWLRVMTELKGRGLEDILIAVVDGLNGFADAIGSVFPQTQVQTCIVHLIRNSLDYCGWKDRKAVAAQLKNIYRAATVDDAQSELNAFEQSAFGQKYPPIALMWRRRWEQVIPFMAYPPEVRKIIYTTNAIESLHMQLRKTIKNRGHFPSDEAASKLMYLALRNISKKWKNAPISWKEAKTQFAIVFGERFMSAAS